MLRIVVRRHDDCVVLRHLLLVYIDTPVCNRRISQLVQGKIRIDHERCVRLIQKSGLSISVANIDALRVEAIPVRQIRLSVVVLSAEVGGGCDVERKNQVAIGSHDEAGALLGIRYAQIGRGWCHKDVSVGHSSAITGNDHVGRRLISGLEGQPWPGHAGGIRLDIDVGFAGYDRPVFGHQSIGDGCETRKTKTSSEHLVETET